MKKFLIGILLTCSIIASAATYRVALDGSGDYTSIADVPALVAGDSLLLKAGDIFREMLTIANDGTEGNYIYVGRYGEGDNPAIFASDNPTSWVNVTGNIWRTSTTFTNLSDDYYAGRMFPTRQNDSSSWGEYVGTDYNDITDSLDYAVDGDGYHYMYCEGNPSTVYKSVEITQRRQCIYLDNHSSYIEINGVDLKYGHRANLWSGYPAPRGATDFILRNLDVAFCGSKGSGSAYMIAIFHSNVLIENCTFSDGGRRAISINTYTDNPGGRYISNIIIRDCEFKRGHHTTSLDLSCMNRLNDTIEDVYFYRNICDDSDKTAEDITNESITNQVFLQGHDDASNVIGPIYIVSSLFVGMGRAINHDNTDSTIVENCSFTGLSPNLPSGIQPWGYITMNSVNYFECYNSIFYSDATSTIPSSDLYFTHGFNSYITEYNMNHNLFFSEVTNIVDRGWASRDPSEGVHDYYTYTQDEWTDYQATGVDANSFENSDPLFEDHSGKDFRIGSTSPARAAGTQRDWIICTDNFGVTDTINKYDYNEFPFESTRSLGAFEYGSFSPSPSVRTYNSFKYNGYHSFKYNNFKSFKR